jgi:Flp pilus assembly protein TadG
MVEFAVVVPIFLTIIFGILEISRALMVKHLLTNAARAGARTGTLEGTSNTDITNAVNAALTNMGISGETVTVEINDNVADAATANPTDEVTVLVSVPVSNISWMPSPLFLSGTITGQYTLRRE